MASASSDAPASRDTVLGKHSSMTSGASPTASKICAPLYEASVLMPILDITLSMPALAALK